MHLGVQTPAGLYLGTTAVQRIYLGTTVAYEPGGADPWALSATPSDVVATWSAAPYPSYTVTATLSGADVAWS